MTLLLDLHLEKIGKLIERSEGGRGEKRGKAEKERRERERGIKGVGN